VDIDSSDFFYADGSLPDVNTPGGRLFRLRLLPDLYLKPKEKALRNQPQRSTS
jgi:hypothetical protein